MSLTAEPAAAASTDPLLAPNPQRFVLFPIKYHQVWEMYKKHEVRGPPTRLRRPRAYTCLAPTTRAWRWLRASAYLPPGCLRRVAA
jgi:hypothetical protein